jgi:hypothetical protein
MIDKFYVRKMNHQELGYTKGKGGGQRGRYILISKTLAHFFPEFEHDAMEPSTSINIISPDNKKLITCEYVWHNNSGHRGKDKRIYLNLDIDYKKDLMPDDFAVFYKIINEDDNSSHIYKIFKFNKFDSEYEILTKITENKNHSVFQELDFIDTSSILYGHYELSKRTREKFRNLINKENGNCSSNEFKNLLRSAYEFKCAISKQSFSIPGGNTNLQAAHIMPDSHGGPLRPDNGLLLSLDYHWAFDYGCFTLDEDLKILVHEKMKNTSLFNINGHKIDFPEDEIFLPNKDFVKYHRENIFGRLRPLRRDEASILN